MKNLLAVTAVVEAGGRSGAAGCPSITASLLVGTPLEVPAAITLARVGGAAILALAIVCWRLRHDAHSLTSRGVVGPMTFYNIAVAAVLAWASLDGLHGVLLWPAVAFHAAMGAGASAT